jgi:hypothetical protein
MTHRVCPDDKKKKTDLVCKNKYYKDGKYKPCKHFSGAGCANPKKYAQERK